VQIDIEQALHEANAEIRRRHQQAAWDRLAHQAERGRTSANLARKEHRLDLLGWLRRFAEAHEER
jgi:hypothetical protein